MLHSILSYYPAISILNDVVQYGSYKTINLYIDLKNTMQTLYMQHLIESVIHMTESSRTVDPSIALSLVPFLSFHKEYALSRGLFINFFIFYEVGRSDYHSNICAEYKVNRRSDDLYGLSQSEIEMFRSVVSSNLRLIDNMYNRVPNVKVFMMERFEADLIPYYLMSRGLVSMSSDVLHLIYSNDRDLLQSILNENCAMFVKYGRVKRIIRQDDVLDYWGGISSSSVNIEYLPLLMSIVGDSSDNIKGVAQIGSKRVIWLWGDILSVLRGENMNSIYGLIEDGKSIFIDSFRKDGNKYKYIDSITSSESTIVRNLKLISFELISRAIDRGLGNVRAKIVSVLEKRDLVPLQSIKSAVSRLGLDPDYINSLDSLYWGNK